MIIQTGWVPKKRNVIYEERPPEIPEWVYTEAQVAKRFYNEQWEFWVWQTSQKDNVPLHIAEDACIRGIKKEILRQYHVYGSKIGRWFEDYLDMEDIFRKVSHPTYLNQLDKV
jgi:hypothetical protein